MDALRSLISSPLVVIINYLDVIAAQISPTFFRSRLVRLLTDKLKRTQIT